jgi:hypothetical protein
MGNIASLRGTFEPQEREGTSEAGKLKRLKKTVAKKLALARRVPVSYFASSALLAECLVSYLSVIALRAEGPVSYLSIAALRAQRNRAYVKEIWRFAPMFRCSQMNSMRVPEVACRGVPSSRRSGAGTS